MFQFIYDFWVQECPFFADYGTWTYITLTAITILGFLRVILIFPLYALGFKRRL